jgi:hypothetical protein
VISGLVFLIDKCFFTTFFGGLLFFSKDDGLPRFLLTGSSSEHSFSSSFNSNSSLSVSDFVSAFIETTSSLSLLFSLHFFTDTFSTLDSSSSSEDEDDDDDDDCAVIPNITLSSCN